MRWDSDTSLLQSTVEDHPQLGKWKGPIHLFAVDEERGSRCNPQRISLVH